MSFRIAKVESLIKHEISNILLFKLNDPAIGFITVTAVRVSPDLRIARVYVSVFEKEKREQVIKRIEEVAGAVRSELASRITLRYVPELRFFLDDTADYVEKIDGLLKKVHENDNPQDS
ncbi:MAG: 30S ribosome-binding factor RbfA [Ignavibacteria bacterium]|nr:30S ribosome-binding factor RbfA [Ignavibacteria bacterium]